VVGTGAGSFRYLFPIYQQRDPELNTPGSRNFWEYAHNDIMQFPIETGAIGTSLLISIMLYWLTALTRACFWRNSLSTCLLAGNLLLLIYSWWDFPFQCPPVLITWCAFWPAAALWTQFQGSRD
jgi:O-antigen ligase